MKKNNKKGFTLVELVIVVAVMAILVAVAIPTVKSITGTARDSVNQTNARTIESVLKLKEAELQNDKTAAATNLSSSAAQTAITAAKLGIDAGEFYYDVDNGKVLTAQGTLTLGENTCWKITFTNGTVSVSVS